MAYRPTNPGWGAAATLAKQPVPIPRPSPPRPDPGGGLGSGDIAGLLADLYATGPPQPDYASIDFDKLAEIASGRASTLIGGATKPFQEIRDRNVERGRLASESATNFTGALAGILQGGKQGEEGMAYAKENFGGSYLGAIAVQQGAELQRQLAWDFNARDIQLSERIAEIAAKQPEIYESILGELVKSAEADVDGRVKLEELAYEQRVKALGLVLAQARFEETQAARGGAKAGKPYVSYFDDPVTGARMGVRPDGRTVRLSGAKPAGAAKPMTASQVANLLSNADQIVQESVANGAPLKSAVMQARLYLRDNGVKNFGQWGPYTTPAGPGAKAKTAPKTYKMGDGSVWKVNPDGSGMTQIKGPGNTGKAKTKKDGPRRLTPNQYQSNVQKATDAARALYYGTVLDERGKRIVAADSPGFDETDGETWGKDAIGYQGALRRLRRTYGLSLEDATGILNEWWKEPGYDGRPFFSAGERQALQRAGFTRAQITKAMRPEYRNGPIARKMLAALGRGA